MERKRICRRMTAVFVFGAAAAACCLRAAAALAALVALLAAAEAKGEGVPDTRLGATNRVLMVDQDGNVNEPGVLATAAQLSSNMVASAAAAARAAAAADAARACSNRVQEILDDVSARELVIYREGYTDSLYADVGLPEGTELAITDFRPFVADGAETGTVVHEIEYACTRDVSFIPPDILTHGTLTSNGVAVSNFDPVPEARIGEVTPVEGARTNGATVYPDVYKVRVTMPDAPSSFFIVSLSGGDTGSGDVFRIQGGISGGATETVEWGGNVMTFRGGLLTGVSPAGAGE